MQLEAALTKTRWSIVIQRLRLIMGNRTLDGFPLLKQMDPGVPHLIHLHSSFVLVLTTITAICHDHDTFQGGLKRDYFLAKLILKILCRKDYNIFLGVHGALWCALITLPWRFTL